MREYEKYGPYLVNLHTGKNVSLKTTTGKLTRHKTLKHHSLEVISPVQFFWIDWVCQPMLVGQYFGKFLSNSENPTAFKCNPDFPIP